MGCFETKEDIPTKINKLTMLKGKMLSTIEINKVKIEGMQKKIGDLDSQIKQGENDLVQNKFSYSETELKTKAKQIYELKKDRQRLEKQVETSTAYNDNLKNNLSKIETKIEELRNAGTIMEGNDVMNGMDDLNTADILQKNIEGMMREEHNQDENLRILKNGEQAMNEGLGNFDDYMNSLLGKGTNGAPPAY